MSASIKMELTTWDPKEIHRDSGKDWSTIEMESLLCNIDEKNLVAPLREAKAAIGRAGPARAEVVEKRRAALALQERWSSWLLQRELLREEIKRGKECLAQVREELAGLHTR